MQPNGHAAFGSVGGSPSLLRGTGAGGQQAALLGAAQPQRVSPVGGGSSPQHRPASNTYTAGAGSPKRGGQGAGGGNGSALSWWLGAPAIPAAGRAAASSSSATTQRGTSKTFGPESGVSQLLGGGASVRTSGLLSGGLSSQGSPSGAGGLGSARISPTPGASAFDTSGPSAWQEKKGDGAKWTLLDDDEDSDFETLHEPDPPARKPAAHPHAPSLLLGSTRQHGSPVLARPGGGASPVLSTRLVGKPLLMAGSPLLSARSSGPSPVLSAPPDDAAPTTTPPGWLRATEQTTAPLPSRPSAQADGAKRAGPRRVDAGGDHGSPSSPESGTPRGAFRRDVGSADEDDDEGWTDDDGDALHHDDVLEAHLNHSTYVTQWEEVYSAGDAYPQGVLTRPQAVTVEFNRGALAVRTKIPVALTLTARQAKCLIAEKLSAKYQTFVDPAAYALKILDDALPASEYMHGEVPLGAYAWIQRRLKDAHQGDAAASSFDTKDWSSGHGSPLMGSASPQKPATPVPHSSNNASFGLEGSGSPVPEPRGARGVEVALVPLSSVLEIVPPNAMHDGGVSALRNQEALLEIRDKRGKILRVRRRSCTKADSQQTVTFSTLDGAPTFEDGCYVFRFIHTHELTLSTGERVASESRSEERVHPNGLPAPDGGGATVTFDLGGAAGSRPRSETGGGGGGAPARRRGFTENMVVSHVRGLVSKEKIRFQQDGYDLDLAYITNDIVAMGFPSSGREAYYRNAIDQVEDFFNKRHGTNYKVYNLCQERTYEMTRFNGCCARYPFFDHCPPPFEQMLVFCKDVHEFLSRDPKSVVSIHCKAGKGRTGTMICAYLLYAERFTDSDRALEFYGLQRTKDGKGVTIPSQIRYVHYFGTLMAEYDRGRLSPPERMLVLHALKFNSVPHYRDGGCDPYFVMSRNLGTSHEKVYDSREESSIKFMVRPGPREGTLKPISQVVVNGDMQVEMFHFDNRYGKSQRMFTFFFNTSFIDHSNVLHLEKKDLDKACKDKEGKYFDDDFTIDCIFKPVEDLPQQL